jgi:predicted GNAT family acetyltransferase
MEIQHSIAGNKGVFFVEENGERLAEMTYTMSGPAKMIIDHTEVNKKLAGKGIGKQLVTKGVEHARKNNMKILPLCPFAKSLFDKIPEFSDVLF